LRASNESSAITIGKDMVGGIGERLFQTRACVRHALVQVYGERAAIFT
jgi:hypothetical protein